MAPAAGPRGWAAALAITLSSCALILAWGRSATFYFDDWDFLAIRRGITLDTLLEPHNEHLSAVPILVFKALLAVFGASSYLPYLTALVLCHTAVCLLLYTIAAPRIGQWAALAPVGLIALLGPAWMDLVWAFQLGFLLSVAAGLALIPLLAQGTRRRDLAAAICIVVSLASSSVGIGFAALAVVLLATSRPLRLSRLWVIAAPAALYVAWAANYGDSQLQLDQVQSAPGYVLEALGHATGSLTGLARSEDARNTVVFPGSTVMAILALAAAAVWMLWTRRVPPLFIAAHDGHGRAVARCVPGHRSRAQRRHPRLRPEPLPVRGLRAAARVRRRAF